MKGRSHRSAPLEDWGDGQWTVDCSCGVNFDDGEEMVSCDECGVWVHTRCSRFVRGEASFACHNCKGAAKRPLSVDVSRDAEETEVAKLLVELPTKTDRCPPAIPSCGTPYRPPFRLWAHVPKEERVHLQGVPGGDPALFRGLSSTIFSANLWKCAGYVPKKFNFKYKEFPCWEEEETDNVNLGADVLFSLSKESAHSAPMGNFEKIFSPNESKKDVEKAFLETYAFGCVKKERNKLRVPGSHLNKGRKEDPVEEKEVNGKKRSMGDSNGAVAHIKDKVEPEPVCNSREEDLCENGDLQVTQSDALGIKSVYKRKDALKPRSKNQDEGMENGNKPKQMLVFKTSRRGLSDEASRSKPLVEPVKEEKVDHLDDRVSCKLNTVVPFRDIGNNTAKSFTKSEDAAKAIRYFKEPKDENLVDGGHNGDLTTLVLDSEKKIPSSINCNGNQPVPDIPSTASGSFSPEKVEITMKRGGDGDQILQNSNFPSYPAADERLSSVVEFNKNQLREKGKETLEKQNLTALQSEEQKAQVVQKDSEVNQSYEECSNTAESEPMVHDNPVGSDPLIEMKGRSDLKDVPKACYAIKLSGAKPNQSVPTIQKVVPTGKELSVSKSPLVSKPSVSNSRNSTSTATSSPLSGKAINVVKQQRMKMNSSSSGKSDTAKDNEQENPPLTLKAVLMAENNVASKSLQAGKISNLSGSKNIPLDSQQPIAIPENLAETPVTTTSITAEVTNLPHSTSNQPKPTPVSSHKSDKVIHPSAPSGSKFSGHSVVSQASPSTNNAAMLSDEELALLLHQELNSSPRVPRVSRMRQAASLQLVSPIATSMLSKRSCVGGRDQVSVFKRKHKEDSIKDGPHKLRDAVVESRRLGQHSPEPKQHESAFLNEGLAKKGKRSRSPDTINPSKAGAVDTSNEGSNSLAPDENGAKTSVRNSPANVGRGGTAVVRSLPGLIDDIMSKGKCSTYEELCDAVRPYWHSLRKPNGERYAYSSHSQAVLDCLRNRSEWAHLIDRGPKTNASKRRRKVDPESSAMESDHEDAKNKGPKEMGDKNSGNSCRDDFPKGKRNVRKPRLLEVRGRGMKEGKNRRRSAFFDDSCPTFSHSSNEETECHANDEDGETDTSSGDSD